MGNLKGFMNVLVLGSGGREHAICQTFRRSSRVSRLFCAPGNAGIAEIAECVPIRPEEIGQAAEFAESSGIGLTFVGGETALAFGIADEFERRGLPIIGPVQQAARLEASKAFAKDFMLRHSIPTANYHVVNSVRDAENILKSGEFGNEDAPVVLKADGLAAGKGVIVAENQNDALTALSGLEKIAGSAADMIVIEEFLEGDEISLLLFSDGRHFSLMPPTRDHKRIGEGDTGPNTGGMGTFTDDELLSDEKHEQVVNEIVEPTLMGCISEGFPFRGILFLGLMMTAAGPKLLEYNVRFGDPETQSILARLETDLADICTSMLNGQLESQEIRWKPGSSATVVLASEGYPDKPRTGDPILGLENAAIRPNVSILHAGTSRNDRGEIVTSGGRVIGVTATGPDRESALSTAYEAVADISWPGMQFRRDIGR